MKAATISELDTKALKAGDILYQAEFVSNKYQETPEIVFHEVTVGNPVPGRQGWFTVKVDGQQKNTNLAYGHYKTKKDACQALCNLFKEMYDTAKATLKEVD